jgi:anti-sigma B factor antagonist
VTHPAAEGTGHIAVAASTGHHGPVVVTLGGELDIASAPALRKQLLSLLRAGTSQLVIDLSAIQYADASGLAVLVGSQCRAVLLGGALRLAAPRPEVVSVLAATGISRHLDVYPTVEAAIAGRDRTAGAVRLGAAPAAAAVLPVQSRAEPVADTEPATAVHRAE